MLDILDVHDQSLMIVAGEFAMVVLSVVQVGVRPRGYSSDSASLLRHASILLTALSLCAFAVTPISPKTFTSSICCTSSRHVLLLRSKSCKKNIPAVSSTFLYSRRARDSRT